MNAAVASEFATVAAAQQRGDLQVVWKSQFGDILIEVRNGAVYVDGDLVESARLGQASPSTHDAALLRQD